MGGKRSYNEGIFVGTVLLEQNDEWQLQHRYMSFETIARLAATSPPPRQKSQPEEERRSPLISTILTVATTIARPLRYHGGLR